MSTRRTCAWSSPTKPPNGSPACPLVPKPQSYYLEQAVGQLGRFETAADQVPEAGDAA